MKATILFGVTAALWIAASQSAVAVAPTSAELALSLRSDYRFEPNGTQGHTYGIALWMPYYGTGVGSWSDYQVRSHWCPWLGIAVDDLNNPDWTKYNRQVAELRSVYNDYFGDYYPLTPYSLDDSAWMAWQFDCPEKGAGLVQAFRHASSQTASMTFKLNGLEPTAVYTLTNIDTPGTTEQTGRQLAEQGLAIVLATQPGAAVITYKKIP